MSGTKQRRTRAIVLVSALVVAAAGCGVSTNEEPQPIARENVPSDLLESGAAAGEAATAADDDVELVSVWFLLDDGDTIQLHAVDRGVPWPAQAALRIDALLDPVQGPSDVERQEGISTAIPGGARLAALPTQDGAVLEVSLSNNFYELRGNNFIRAVAQVVFTATEIPSVATVRFLDQEGDQAPVQDGDGEERDEPMGREDFENLSPVD